MDTGVIFAVVASIIVAAVVVGILVSRIKVSDPDEAIIISGAQDKSEGTESKIILGGAKAFVIPFLQKWVSMSLETRQITWEVRESPSSQNIFVTLEGVANVKVGGTQQSVRAAIERFNVNPDNIKEFTRQNIESDMRAIVGTMTVEEINGNRERLKDEVTKIIGETFAQWGLVLETLSIQSVFTPGGYMDDLARPVAAQALRDAEIAEAITKREAAEAQAEADKAIAEADRGVLLKRAEVKADTDKAEEDAAAAGPIAAAQQRQAILAQEREAARMRAEVTEQELESTVRRPADAEAYAVEVQAKAERDARILQAEAEAKQVELSGAADGAATRSRGEAEAAIIQARGEAEAVAIEKKAEAYKDYPQAGMLDIALGEDGVAGVARAVADPIASIENMNIVSNDGASKLTQLSSNTIAETFSTIKNVSGIDLLGFLSNLAGDNGAPVADDRSDADAALIAATRAGGSKSKGKSEDEPTVDSER